MNGGAAAVVAVRCWMVTLVAGCWHYQPLRVLSLSHAINHISVIGDDADGRAIVQTMQNGVL